MAPSPKHENLPEVVRNDADLPQVVENYQSLPEVVHHETRFPTAAEEKQGGGGYSVTATAVDPAQGQANHYQVLPQHEQNGPGPDTRDRRIWGLKRRTFLVVVVLAIVVVVAAVAGGVAGGISSSNKSTTSSPSSTPTASSSNSSSSSTVPSNTTTTMRDFSGLSILSPPGSSTVYTYHVNAGGDIIESAFSNAAWAQSGNLSVAKVSIVAQGIGATSISAVSYTSGGRSLRSIFYLQGTAVKWTNTTGSNGWSTPHTINTAGTPAAPSSGLTAIADTNPNGLSGIRVYFGSSSGGAAVIQEVGMDFVDAVWHVWFPFAGGDNAAGVAGVLVNNAAHVYFRNTTAGGALQQWTWDYLKPVAWTLGVSSSTSNLAVASGGNIAAATDGSGSDFIFYQASAGQTTSATFTTGATGFSAGSSANSTIASLQATQKGYALAATWAGGEAVVLGQNTTATAELVFTSVGEGSGKSAAAGIDTRYD